MTLLKKLGLLGHGFYCPKSVLVNHNLQGTDITMNVTFGWNDLGSLDASDFDVVRFDVGIRSSSSLISDSIYTLSCSICSRSESESTELFQVDLVPMSDSISLARTESDPKSAEEKSGKRKNPGQGRSDYTASFLKSFGMRS